MRIMINMVRHVYLFNYYTKPHPTSVKKFRMMMNLPLHTVLTYNIIKYSYMFMYSTHIIRCPHQSVLLIVYDIALSRVDTQVTIYVQ